MRVLKLYSKPSPFSFAVNLKLKFPDVKAAVARAQSLKKELSTAEYAEEIQEF
jgi:hypothetical protein